MRNIFIIHRQGRRKTGAAFESNKILRGMAEEGDYRKSCESWLGRNTPQDYCEYNLFHYEWYPFNE